MRKVFWLSLCLAFSFLSSSIIATETEVLFSPDDRPTKRLIELINQAKIKIHAAVYMITDKTIAEALIDAKINRGVDVQIVTDKITYDSSYGKGKLLEAQGVPLFIYSEAKASKTEKTTTRFWGNDPIMHHKFALFDDKKLWTGSFNWTASANRYNQENVMITDNKKIFRKFKDCFERLKLLSRQVDTLKNNEASSQVKTPPFDSLLQQVKVFLMFPKSA